MIDFSFVTSRLATGGGIADAADVQILTVNGVTHVIDCRAEFDDDPLFRELKINYLWNPTADDGQHKDSEWFRKSLDFALPALALPRTKVYAHCAAGINRGPSTAYVIIRAFGLMPLESKSLIIGHRPVTLGGIRYANDADAALNVLGYG